MAEQKKPKSPIIVTPKMVASLCYIDKPDDKAPPGVAWKPDGKFKLTGILDSMEELAPLEAAIKKFYAETYPDVPMDEEAFQWPWKQHDEDAKSEHLRGKATITPKTKNKLEANSVVDSRRHPVKAVKMPNGDLVRVFGGDVVKCSITLYPYDKVEEQTVVEGGKKRKVSVKVYGCSLQLGAVQVIEKRAGGGGYASAFADEDGFVQGDDVDDGETSAAESEGGAGDDAEDF